jgi:malonate-semialdehyde dehydrogenase (acetylating) / methylmalonate-semialdehyde dehydrogenase
MTFNDPAPVGHHIAGRRMLLGPLLPLHGPANGQIQRWVHHAEGPQIVQAVASAATAQAEWAGGSPVERDQVLRRLHQRLEAEQDLLAAMLSAELGKTPGEALAEVRLGLQWLAEGGGATPQGLHRAAALDEQWTLDEPLGVVAAATPFCEPLASCMALLPAASAAGNALIWKPSPLAPSLGPWMAEALLASGAPPGLLQVLQGGPEVAQGLLHHPQVAAFALLGSNETARAVRARGAELGKPVLAVGSLFNHGVVMPDADLDALLPALLRAAYGCAGQQGLAMSTLVLVGTAGDALMPRLAERVQQLRAGPPHWPNTDFGPLVSAQERARVEALIEAGARDGAQLWVDGRGLQVAGHLQGHYLGGTLFDHVQPWMQIAQQPPFGPVLLGLRVRDLDGALQLLQERPGVHAACLFTRDGAAARAFAQAAPVARVGINVTQPAPADGLAVRRFFSRQKAVQQRWRSG